MALDPRTRDPKTLVPISDASCMRSFGALMNQGPSYGETEAEVLIPGDRAGQPGSENAVSSPQSETCSLRSCSSQSLSRQKPGHALCSSAQTKRI